MLAFLEKSIFKKLLAQKNFNIRIEIHNQSGFLELPNYFDKFGLKTALLKPQWDAASIKIDNNKR